jgi:hypothetical protein
MILESEALFLTQSLPGYAGGRLTLSPERLRIGANREADFAHPTASAFSILNEHCLVTCRRGVHTRIFAALRRRLEAADFDVSEYGVEAWPELGEPEIAWFQRFLTGDMGALRERTLSGRIWKDIALGSTRRTVISFWVERGQVSDSVLYRAVKNLSPDGTALVEFSDSTEPRYVEPRE